MEKEKYHHGDLKQKLIENGLALLNKEGVEGFSLRKVASMCGVSHNAPYKHFKDKEELINEIIEEVWKSFYLALAEVSELYSDNPKLKIAEIGKAYVKFMVDNPEYLKFLFLLENKHSINIKEDKFCGNYNNSFNVFIKGAEDFLKSINLDKSLYLEKTLTMWSLVHGIAVLISKRSIVYDGDYLDIVEKMIMDMLRGMES